MARSTSVADQQLLDELRGRGLQVSSAQLERWRAARLLPKPARTPLGRGRGSTSEYPPEALEIAALLAQLGGRGVPVHRGVLGLFFVGQPVPLDRLRDAIRWVVSDGLAADLNLVPAITLGMSALSSEGPPPSGRLSPQARAAAENIAVNGVNEVGSAQVLDALAELSMGPITIDTKKLNQRLLDRELAGEPLVPPSAAWAADGALALADLPLDSLDSLDSLRSEAAVMVAAATGSREAADSLATTYPEVLLIAMVTCHVTRAAMAAFSGDDPVLNWPG